MHKFQGKKVTRVSETFSLGIQYIILLSSINHITCLNVWDECNCLILRLLNNTVFNNRLYIGLNVIGR